MKIKTDWVLSMCLLVQNLFFGANTFKELLKNISEVFVEAKVFPYHKNKMK